MKIIVKDAGHKYRFRADKKNGEEDRLKAEFYETKLIELGGIK